jgi:hypothetical protein
MAYIPNASDDTNPLDTVDRSTAAAEFRVLKKFIHEVTTVPSSATPDIFNAPTQAINYTGTVLATGFVAALVAGMIRRLFIPAAAQFTAGANLTIDGVAAGTTITVNPGTVLLVVAVTTTSFRLMMEADVGTIQGYAGELRQGFFAAAPIGWYLVPNAVQAPVARAGTYANISALLAAAPVPYPFGAGDGVTTFVMPWIPSGYALSQGISGLLGQLTVGSVISHNHTINMGNPSAGTDAPYTTNNMQKFDSTNVPSFHIGATGGPANYAAALPVNFILKL